MSQKQPLPSLTGHRLKPRKRDEKKQYDPSGFRDSILEGLNEAGQDLEAVSKFLDTSSSKLDYRRYGGNLVEILIAGGLLAPGGSIVQDGQVNRTDTCLFVMADSMEMVRAWEQVFTKLERRFKFLEKMHEEEMNKILVYLKGFTPQERQCLARITALWLASGQVPPTILPILINERQVNDGTSLEFLLETFSVLKQEKGGTAVINVIKRSGIEARLMDFFPLVNQQQTEENFNKTFLARDLPEVVSFRKNQAAQGERNELHRAVRDAIAEDRPVKEIIAEVKEGMSKNTVQEYDAVVMIWSCVMSAVEWNKKEDLLQDQAMRHLKKYVVLFAAFTKNTRSELALLNRIQEYCYDNMNFLKSFNKIVLLLYKTDVLCEEVILKWYKDAHSSRGWSVFMDQMKKFVEWLEHAEEDLKRFQSRQVPDEILFSVTELVLHPDWRETPKRTLMEKTRQISTLALIETQKLIDVTETGPSHADRWKKIEETVELLLVFPTRLLIPNVSQKIWDLVEDGLNAFKVPDDSKLARLLWTQGIVNRLIKPDYVILGRLLESHHDFFQNTLMSLFNEVLENSPDLLWMGHDPLILCLAQNPSLFRSFLEFAEAQLLVLDCDMNFVAMIRSIGEMVLKKANNPVALFPIDSQTQIALICLLQRNDDSENCLETLIQKCVPLHNISIVLFPQAYQKALHYSSLHRKVLHVMDPFSKFCIKDVHQD
ncbi:protein krasavietz-like isoform X2 [Tigriopus californicus]|uniref:protein krasavietz-like isoform X2 n=1 Tax=Tigriopus californicus TaxID=6832 RepID=UPI0027D9F8D5|nr:protein krasavietz-like isoform X2 [Tigriopus californicus]